MAGHGALLTIAMACASPPGADQAVAVTTPDAFDTGLALDALDAVVEAADDSQRSEPVSDAVTDIGGSDAERELLLDIAATVDVFGLSELANVEIGEQVIDAVASNEIGGSASVDAFSDTPLETADGAISTLPCDDGDPCTVDTQLPDGSCDLGFAITSVTLEKWPKPTTWQRYLQQYAVASDKVIYTRWVYSTPNYRSPVVAAYDRLGAKLWQHPSKYDGNPLEEGYSKKFFALPPCSDAGALFTAGPIAVEACNGWQSVNGEVQQVVGVNIFNKDVAVISKPVLVVPSPLYKFETNSTKGVGYPNGEFVLLTGMRLADYGTLDPQLWWWAMRLDKQGNVLWITKLDAVGTNAYADLRRVGTGFVVFSWLGGEKGTFTHLYDANGKLVAETPAGLTSNLYQIESDVGPIAVLVAGMLDNGGSYLAKRKLSGETIWQTDYPEPGVGQVAFWQDGVFFYLYPFVDNPALSQRFIGFLDASGTEVFRRLVQLGDYVFGGTPPPAPLARNRLAVRLQNLNPPDTVTSDQVALHILDPWGHATCAEAGVCASKTLEECLDTDPCTADDCDPKLGCTHVPLPDDATCNWSTGAKCKKGLCK